VPAQIFSVQEGGVILSKNPFVKVFRAVDRFFFAFFENLGGIFIAAIFVIVIAAVLCRYVFHVSMRGIDEFNYYFMTLVIWVGSAATARNFENGHIKVDLLSPFLKNDKILGVIGVFWQIIAEATMVFFTKLSWEYMLYAKGVDFSMSGLSFPLWVFLAGMTVCSAFISIYEFANLFYIAKKKLLRPGIEPNGLVLAEGDVIELEKTSSLLPGREDEERRPE
jgi:TRAP-type C4-dicarboxylate transport system permease small subunit